MQTLFLALLLAAALAGAFRTSHFFF